jgi:hypothetical protein
VFYTRSSPQCYKQDSWNNDLVARLEAGSNTSTVTLRVVGGEKKEPSAWGYKWAALFLFSVALPAHSGPWPLIQFRNLFFTDGRTPWVRDQFSLCRYLYTGKQNKRIHTPNIHALSGIRNHDPSVRANEDSSCLRPRGYCGRPTLSLGGYIYTETWYSRLGVLRCETVKCGLSPAGLGPETDCTGEGQQQVCTTDPFSRQKGYHIRTISLNVQLENEIIGRQSQGDCRQDELIGGKLPVVKQLWLWEWAIYGRVTSLYKRENGSRGHCWDLSPGNALWTHSILRRFHTCCSELQSVWISDSTIVTCSYDL